MAGNDTTVKFRADISQLKSQMQAAERQIKLVNSEFKAATAGMDDWSKSADGLQAKTKQLSSVLEQQNKKLELMEKELEATSKAYGENSAQADRVRIKINEQKAAIAKTESQLSTYGKKLEELGNNMDSAADGSKEFLSATDKLKSSIADQEDKLSSLKKHYADLVAEGKGLSSEAKETASQIKELSGELNENKTKLKEAEGAADDFDQSLDTMDDAAQKASDGFTVMKGALANLVADGIRLAIDGIKDLAKETFTVGSNFESAMSQVGAVSGANAEEMEKLTAKAEEMGAKTKFSATESAEAFNYMAMAGWKTEDMLGGIEGIMNLAAASGSDLATASDIVTDALTAMGYEAKDSGRLADVMAAASANANTNVEMMGKTFQYAAPIVGALGYSMEDTAVAIGLMANAGIKADKAGTALRSIFTRLSAPPKEAAEAMDALGISLTDSEGKMKDMHVVIDELRDRFANLSETEQTSYAKHLAGAEAMSGLLAIVNAAPADYEKLTKAVQESAGAAENMANIMNDNVGGQLTLLKSKIEGIMIKLFNRASGSMKKGIDTFSQALDKVNWDKVGDGIGKLAEKAADFFLYVVNNSDKVVSTLKTIGTVIGTIFISNKIATFASAFGSLVTAVTSAKTVTGGLSTAVKLLGVNMNALPIMMVIGALALLNAELKAQEQRFKDNAQAAYGLSDEEQKLIDKTNENAQALENANAARKDAGESIDVEYDHIRDLKDQYNELIDENGNVIHGYEDFASTIKEDLAEALGVAVEDIDKNIDANGRLGDSIDLLIQKKENEAKLAAFEGEYNEAVKNQVKTVQELAEADRLLIEKQDALTEAQEAYNKAQEDWDKNLNPNKRGELLKNLNQEKANLEEAKSSYEDASAGLKTMQDTYNQTQAVITHYHDAMEASYENNQEKVNNSLTAMQYSLLEHSHASKEALEGQYINTKTELEKIEDLYAQGDVSEDVVENYRKINELAGAELDAWVAKNEQAGKDSVDKFAGSATDALDNAFAASEKLGSGSTLALQTSLGNWGDLAAEQTGDFLGILGDKEGEATEKGETLGHATAEGAKSKAPEFEEAAKESADIFNTTIEDGKGTYETSGVFITDITADAATREAEAKMPEPGEKVVKTFSDVIAENKDQAKVAGETISTEAAAGADEHAGDAETSGNNFAQGFINGIASFFQAALNAGKNLAASALGGLKTQQKEGSPSKVTTQSGEYFGEGYANGINSTKNTVIKAAEGLAIGAVNALNSALKNAGTPSELTYASGKSFTSGFAKGMAKLESKVVGTAKSMITNVVSELSKLNDFNFDTVSSKASKALSDSMSKKLKYTSGWLNYNAKQQVSEFDKTISSLQAESDKKVEKAEEKSQKKQNKIKKKADKEQDKIQKKIDAIKKKKEKDRSDEEKKQLKKLEKQLEKSKKKETKNLDKEKKATEKATDKLKDSYNKQIATQQEMKESYQEASSAMISEFTSAMQEYQTAAQELIDSTMEGITSKYQAKYDELIGKQDNLISKLREAGDMFSLENANVMTTTDLKAQTAQITRYANKLKSIKGKVSTELFDQIASYDMKEGEAFIDRLTRMSQAELAAYDAAYKEKIAAAESLSKDIYKSDFDKLETEYRKEIKEAFSGIEKELEELGQQCMQGFLEGLTENTDYMSGQIKTFISGMIDTFKSELGIHSPSRVTKALGKLTSEGFADGIEANADLVTKAIEDMTKNVANGFDWSRLSVIDGFSSAMADFESEAKDVITKTLSDIGSTYQTKFDEIISKQDSLKSKLKGMGDLFTISSANVIRLGDINSQVKEMEDYVAGLQKIKGKVSSALYDQINTYSAKEGAAFIEQLLAMSDKELSAYSQAYDRKMSLADQLSENLYKSDLNKVAGEYDKAVENAFKSMPATLSQLGYQSMQGFLEGLGGNSKYLTDSVKAIVNGVVNTFKSELGIHSPSKVMMQLGEFCGEGFADGLSEMVKTVKDAAQEITDTVSSALDWDGDISGARGTLKQAAASTGLNRNSGQFGGASTQIINFNQTNNSPKALDRLTLYRQTNNMLFSAKVRLSDV